MISKLDKRCFATSALVHATLAALLLFAPGLSRSRENQPGEGPPLELMAGELIDAALAPGFLKQEAPENPPEAAEPPPAAPRKSATPEPPPEPEPQPEPPQQIETPKTPPAKAAKDEPDFDLPKAREPGFILPSTKGDDKSKDKPKRPEKDEVKIDLSKAKVLKPNPNAAQTRKKPVPAEPTGPSAEDLARQRREDLARSLEGASGRIAGAVAKGTVQIQVGPAGGGGGGAGGTSTTGGSAYAWHVRNAFINAWIAPQNVRDAFATADVTVVIRKDGKVVQARIVKRSGIAALDRSVQDAVDRVREIVPFEAGATEDQRTYTIGFNLRSKYSF
ncbi:MAG: TonB family protein [Verrucomicrobiales bacterium]|nr:TonB family protein [Verrucomicrobiales bacterium]